MKCFAELQKELTLQQIELFKTTEEIKKTMQEIQKMIAGLQYDISELWVNQDIKHPEWLKFNSVWEDKYISLDYSTEMITEDISKKVKKIENELEIIKVMTKDDEDTVHNFKLTLDFDKCMKDFNGQ